MFFVAQLNKDGFFVGPVSDHGGPMPHGCIAEFPPNTPRLADYHHWRWDGKKYVQTPDYRGCDVYAPDGAVYQPAAWGPLPEGHSLTAPPPSEEQKRRERVTAIDVRLAAIDRASIRPCRAVCDLFAVTAVWKRPLSDLEKQRLVEEEDRLAVLEGEAKVLRAERSTLMGDV